MRIKYHRNIVYRLDAGIFYSINTILTNVCYSKSVQFLRWRVCYCSFNYG